MVRKWIFFLCHVRIEYNVYILNEWVLELAQKVQYILLVPSREWNKHKERYDANALQGANFIWNLRWIPLYRISLDWFSILIAVICLFLIRQSSVAMFSIFFSILAFSLPSNAKSYTNSNVYSLQMYISKWSYIWTNTRRKNQYIHRTVRAKKTAMATDRNVYGEVSFEIGFGNV